MKRVPLVVAGHSFVLWMKFKYTFISKDSYFFGIGLSSKGVIVYASRRSASLVFRGIFMRKHSPTRYLIFFFSSSISRMVLCAGEFRVWCSSIGAQTTDISIVLNNKSFSSSLVCFWTWAVALYDIRVHLFGAITWMIFFDFLTR